MPSKASKYIHRALDAEAQNHIVSALENFSTAFRLDHKSVAAQTGKIRCLLHFIDEQEKLEEGLDLISRLIDPALPSFTYNLLKLKFLWRLGNHIQAMKWAEMMDEVHEEEDDLDFVFTKARILSSHSIRRWTQAKKLAQKLPLAQQKFIQARHYMINKDFSNAGKYFLESVSKMQFEDSAAVDNYLIAIHQLKNKSEKELKKAISIGQEYLEKYPQSLITWKIAINTMDCFLDLYSLHEKIKDNELKKEKTRETGTNLVRFVDHLQRFQKDYFDGNFTKTWPKNSILLYILNVKSRIYNYLEKYTEALVANDEAYSYVSDLGIIDDEVRYEYRKMKNNSACYIKLPKLTEKEQTTYYKTSINSGKKILKLLKTSSESRLAGVSPKEYEKFVYYDMMHVYKKMNDTKKYKLYKKKFENTKKELEELSRKTKSLSQESKTRVDDIPEPSIIFDGEESNTFEFKASFFLYDDSKYTNEHEKKKKHEEIHQDIAESVCAFLNSQGGRLIIGVDNETHVCHGIDHDISKTPGKQTVDVYSQTVQNIIKSFFVKEKFYPNNVFFNPYQYPPDSLPERSKMLYEITVIPLPDNEPKPAVMKVSQSGTKCPNCKETVSPFGKTTQIVFRDGDGDQTYTDLIEGMVEWNKRQQSQRQRMEQ